MLVPSAASTAPDAVTAYAHATERLGAGAPSHITEWVSGGGSERLAEAAAARARVLGELDEGVSVSQVVVPGFFAEVDVFGVQLDVDAETSDVVYLPSVLPLDADGNLVGEGDVVAQAAQVFHNAEVELAKRGLGMDQVVMTVDYTTLATIRDYKHTGAPRREALGPVYPGAAGILMDALAHPGALFQLEVTASRVPTKSVNPGWSRYSKLTYSPAVEAGELLFMSGQGALDPETETALFAGDIVKQAEYTYGNIVTVLETAGLDASDLISLVEYVTPAGRARWTEVAAVRDAILGDHQVALTQVQCAGLLRREFEIEVIPLARRRRAL